MARMVLEIEYNEGERRHELVFSNGKKAFATYVTDTMLKDGSYTAHYLKALLTRLEGDPFG